MVNEYWDLSKRPFSNTPDLDFLFNSDGFEEGYARLLYNIVEIKGGLTLVTGEIGSGKTYLANALIEDLGEKNVHSFLIKNPRVSSTQLLKIILQNLGSEKVPRFKLKVLNKLENRLIEFHEKGIPVVALIDEAQMLSLDALREIRLLLNMETSEKKLLHLVLLGQPEFKNRIDRVPQLKQRVNVRFHLEPLTREEAHKYIRHRLKIAGGDENIFTAESLNRLYEISEGLPRIINNIAQNALFVGATAEANEITSDIIDSVASDLEV